MAKQTKWSKIIGFVASLRGNDRTFIFDDEKFRFEYIGYEDTRMGFMNIWNEDTKRAIHISRLKIPDGMAFINMHDNETYNERVPNDLIFENSKI